MDRRNDLDQAAHDIITTVYYSEPGKTEAATTSLPTQDSPPVANHDVSIDGDLADNELETTKTAPAFTRSKIPFNFCNHTMTTIVDGDGNPWWIAKEICDLLGYANSRKAVKDHCNYPKILKRNESSGLEFGPRGVNIINEPDLYRLVLRSHLPAAQKFECWVMEEVLLSIRKIGAYTMSVGDPMSNLEVMRLGMVAAGRVAEQLAEESGVMNPHTGQTDYDD
jgi:hypothetical protein